jgi:hypothetical protein
MGRRRTSGKGLLGRVNGLVEGTDEMNKFEKGDPLETRRK